MDDVWREHDTTPARIEAALRRLFVQRHREERPFVPARVLNTIVIVEAEFRGEIENRMERVGRYHPSRLIVCAVEAGRRTLDAWAAIGGDEPHSSGELAIGRERVEITVGERHLAKLDTIVDPLLVSDLSTLVWAPHGHQDAVDAVRRLAQVVLIDSQDAPHVDAALERAADLAQHAYVVDLAWLRSTPWRERVAALFDPPAMRPALAHIAEVNVRHREDSAASALLYCGWLTSRLGWRPGSLAQSRGRWIGHAGTKRQDIRIQLEPVDQNAPGLAGVTIVTDTGEALSLDRAPGGLRAGRRDRRGRTQEWTVLGASRGESGILGEGVRQALLRDPTYKPALSGARAMVG